MTQKPNNTPLSGASLLGQTLQNQYLLQELIGQGGMAWIFKGLHKRLELPLVVKVLFPQVAEDPRIRARFLDEGKIQFSLKHPYIVQVTDFIEDMGLLGLVLEWVPGEDLRIRLQRTRGPLPLHEVWQIFEPVLKALGYAHQKGLVHRDIKPANLLIQTLEDRLIAKISDFGIAKLMSQRASSGTQTGSTLGTMKYISPEQLKDSKAVDHRSDIYSLGVTLYHTIMGIAPFEGDPQSLVYKHVFEEPPSMQTGPFQVPKQLEALVFRCLCKDPEQRYQNCAEILDDLEDCLANYKETPLSIHNPLPTGSMVGRGENQLYSKPEDESITPSPQSAYVRASDYAPAKVVIDSSISSTNLFQSEPKTQLSNKNPFSPVEKETTSPTKLNHSHTVPKQKQTLERQPSPTQKPSHQTVDNTMLSFEGMTDTQFSKPHVQSQEGQGQAPTKQLREVVRPPEPQHLLRQFKVHSPQPELASPKQPKSQIKLVILLLFLILASASLLLYALLAPKTKQCKPNESKVCYSGSPATKGIGICKAGQSLCNSGTFGPCMNQVTPQIQELCNGKDDNCNGQVDESFANKGHSCISSQNTCPSPGRWRCNGSKLTCISEGKSLFRLKIKPKNKRFTIRYDGEKQQAKATLCISYKKQILISVKAKGYSPCSFRVPKTKKVFQIFMKKQGELDEIHNYCKNP